MLKDINGKMIYHGSYMEVSSPDLSLCKEGKDFGKGFYTTTDRGQAIKFAKRIARIYGYPYGVLNLYKSSTFSGLSVCEFTTTSEEWLNCVIGFRSSRFRELSDSYKGFDIIMGKIADDDTSRTINAYMANAYGAVGTEDAISMAIRNLIPNNLKNQITFKSESALNRIKFIRSEEIWL